VQLQAAERDARVIEHRDLHIALVVHRLPVAIAIASNLADGSAGFHGQFVSSHASFSRPSFEDRGSLICLIYRWRFYYIFEYINECTVVLQASTPWLRTIRTSYRLGVESFTLQENRRNKEMEKKARVSHACDSSRQRDNDDCNFLTCERVYVPVALNVRTPHVVQNTAYATIP